MAPTIDGITLQTYLPNLSDDDIELLLSIAQGGCGRKSPMYAKWIAALCQTELERRASEDTEQPAEADLPKFNGSRWTGADLADALQASNVALAVSTDQAGAHELLTKLDEVIRAWCAHRLRKIG